MDFDSNDPEIAEQIPINQALVEELIAFIPESWRAAELRLEWLPDSKGISQLVVCPDTGEGWTVSHDMVQVVLKLDQHRKKYHLNWRSAVYGVRLDENDMWQATANFAFECLHQSDFRTDHFDEIPSNRQLRIQQDLWPPPILAEARLADRDGL